MADTVGAGAVFAGIGEGFAWPTLGVLLAYETGVFSGSPLNIKGDPASEIFLVGVLGFVILGHILAVIDSEIGDVGFAILSPLNSLLALGLLVAAPVDTSGFLTVAGVSLFIVVIVGTFACGVRDEKDPTAYFVGGGLTALFGCTAPLAVRYYLNSQLFPGILSLLPMVLGLSVAGMMISLGTGLTSRSRSLNWLPPPGAASGGSSAPNPQSSATSPTTVGSTSVPASSVPYLGSRVSPSPKSVAQQTITPRRSTVSHPPSVPVPAWLVPPKPRKGPTVRTWPGVIQYNDAMKNLNQSAVDPEIRTAQILRSPTLAGSGFYYWDQGNRSVVSKVALADGRRAALKCFISAPPDVAQRYLAIGSYIRNLGLPCLIDVRYVERALQVPTGIGGVEIVPALTMEWLDSPKLSIWISEHYTEPAETADVAKNFLDAASQIQSHGIEHGDIASENVLIGKNNSVKFIDYDGMYIPAFRGQKSPGELGHSDFQHPLRSLRDYGPGLDNFSCLVTYLSLLAIAEKPSRYETFNEEDSGDYLIFRKTCRLKDCDTGSGRRYGCFLTPSQCRLFRELGAPPTGQRIRRLQQLLLEALRKDPIWSGCSPSVYRKF